VAKSIIPPEDPSLIPDEYTIVIPPDPWAIITRLPETEPAAPNQDQFVALVWALFRHATVGNYVSLQTFIEGRTDPLNSTPHRLSGNLEDLIEQAFRAAEAAAHSGERLAFCPPIATFTNPSHAREEDFAEGLALSINYNRPMARIKIEELLGPSTVAVKSGGTWTDPQTGKNWPKLHTHHRLKIPARSKDEHEKLKLANKLVAKIVGNDPSNVPLVYPIRWPGSLHRKDQPKLCRIISFNPDAEIDLDSILEILRKAAEITQERPPEILNGGETLQDTKSPPGAPTAQLESPRPIPAPNPQRHARFLHLARRYIIPATGRTEGLRLVFDVEANGLLDAATKGHCIVAIDLDSDQVDEFGPNQIEAGLARLSEAQYLVGHNIVGYDLPLLRKLYGWSPVLDCIVVDTLIAGRLIFPHLLDLDQQAQATGDPSLGKLTGRHSLEAWGARLGMPKIGTDIEIFSEWTPKLQQRCVGDVRTTTALWRFLQPDGQPQAALFLEHRVAAICDRMAADGVSFNIARAEHLCAQWATRRTQLEAQLQQQFPQVKNWNSRKQIIDLLMSRGWVPEQHTEKGNPKLDEEALETVAAIWPELANLSEFFALGILIAKIANGEKSCCKYVAADERIHTAPIHIGTPHSRAQYASPNLGGIPNPKKGARFGNECRTLFAAREGWAMIACDQNNLQDRGLAHYLAKFDGGAYAKLFINGVDTHWLTASNLDLIAKGTERDKARTTHTALREGSKKFRYAFLYGAGAARIGRIILDICRTVQAIDPNSDLRTKFFGTAEHPNKAALEQVGKRVLDRFMAATPGLAPLRKMLEQQAAMQQWVLGLDGRHVPTGEKYKALNRIVTASEAVICKWWLVSVYNELCARFRYGPDGDAYITLWLHDELVVSCRQEIAEQVAEILVRHAKLAGEHYGLKVPLDAECKVGCNWAGDPINKSNGAEPPITPAEPAVEAAAGAPEPIKEDVRPAPEPEPELKQEPKQKPEQEQKQEQEPKQEQEQEQQPKQEPKPKLEPRRKPETHQINFAEASLPAALIPLTTQSRWVCWRWEWRNNKWTKPPIQPGNGFPAYARNNDSSTWGIYAEAVKRVIDGSADGIGFCLLGSDAAAIDLDHCCSLAPRAMADWAQALVGRAPENTYCEVTVSGTGLRLIGLGSGFELHRKFPAGDGKGSFELYRKTARYITVSGKVLDGATGPLQNIDDLLDELLGEASQRTAGQQASKPTGKWARGGMTERLYELIADGVAEPNRSSQFFAAVAQLKRLGWSVDGIVWLLEKHPNGIANKYAGRLSKEVERAFDKIVPDGACLSDFYAYMPQHQFFYAPARRLWPAASIDARMPKMALIDREGKLVLAGEKEDSKPVLISASKWLDQNRPIEEMTWAPGEPMLIHDRLMIEAGWISKPGATTFNLYIPPIIEDGDPRKALPWVRLVFKVYGKDAKHMIRWFAHRVQRPGEKINHGIVEGGVPGIGKDTILAPVRKAIGEWNFQDVTPKDMFESFNPHNRAVILRVNEMRDLGEMSQYAFYNHMKRYLAAPPEALRTNEKHIKQYYLPNVCGVVFTLNDKEIGMYLPPDDRRHSVAWSDRKREDFPAEYWSKIWDWYADGGFGHVAAYLRQFDLSKFRPKEPPLKTPAFWDIANANRATEETALQDALDFLGRPAAVTIKQVLIYPDYELGEWFRDRKNRRVVPKHFRECGYVVVHNPDRGTGLWVINGQRQTVYAREELPPRDRLDAARQLTKEKE
jgi:DNA polymerase I-like protein with 3'-5' exonuclease and polymerase domains